MFCLKNSNVFQKITTIYIFFTKKQGNTMFKIFYTLNTFSLVTPIHFSNSIEKILKFLTRLL